MPLRAAGGGPDPGRLGADDGGPLLCPDGLLQLRGCDPGIRNPGQGLLHPARDVGDRTLKTHVLLHYDVFQASESATQAKWRVPGLRNAHYKKVFGTLLARSASLRGRDQVGGGGGEDGDETEEIDDGNLRLISQDVCCIYDGQKTGRDLMLSAETQNAVPKMPFRGTSDQHAKPPKCLWHIRPTRQTTKMPLVCPSAAHQTNGAGRAHHHGPAEDGNQSGLSPSKVVLGGVGVGILLTLTSHRLSRHPLPPQKQVVSEASMWGVGVAFMVTLVPLPPHAAHPRRLSRHGGLRGVDVGRWSGLYGHPRPTPAACS